MSTLKPLVARDLSKAYADRVVLTGVDLVVNPGEPVGLVGENGVGKSTLLRLICGVEPADGGSVTRPAEMAYLSQQDDFPPAATVAEVLSTALAPLHDAVRRLEDLAHDLADPRVAEQYAETLDWVQHHQAWDADRRAELASHRLGLEAIEPDRPVAEMSGGERSRLALAALITRQPECVILDEPTNHLDDSAMEFLEGFLREMPGVVLVASHDRMFLENVCEAIVDLDESHFGMDGSGGNRFVGGYTSYVAHKQAARHRWERAFVEQRDELNDLRRASKTTARQVAPNRAARDNDKFIYNFKGANVQSTVSRRVRNAEQRVAAIERDLIPKPPPQIRFTGRLGGDPGAGGYAVFLRDVRVGDRLEVPRLDLTAGERLLVTGANGAGKSTLLQLIAGRLPADSGLLRVTAKAVGLLEQELTFDQPERTPHQVYAAATGSPVPLGDLGLLHPRELGRPVGELSVGQQRRLGLAILVARRPDLLLLDEPTNHISPALATELEEAIGHSTGTLVVTSHDRWLRRRWEGPTLSLADRPA